MKRNLSGTSIHNNNETDGNAVADAKLNKPMSSGGSDVRFGSESSTRTSSRLATSNNAKAATAASSSSKTPKNIKRTASTKSRAGRKSLTLDTYSNSPQSSVVCLGDSDMATDSSEAPEITYSKPGSSAMPGAISSLAVEHQEHDFKYTFVTHIKEDHNCNLYDIQIYRPHEPNPDEILFATVGSNRCSVYEYNTRNCNVQLVEAYMDGDTNVIFDQPMEVYYTCTWTTDPNTYEPLLLVGGLKGIIRTIAPFKSRYRLALIGHGSSVNELRMHPTRHFILLSSSKDCSMRLWNINTGVCIAIFGGVEGHRDEVLSADFNLSATRIMSCSIDHSLKMWQMDTSKLVKAIDDSETFTSQVKSFPTVMVHFPDYTTRDVHKNYVDCVRWFGDLILSKSCENCVICWKPGLMEENIRSIARSNKNVTILHKFNIKDCEIWFMRFCLDFERKYMALGTQTGKIFIWDLNAEGQHRIKRTIVTNTKSKALIRAIAMSVNGEDMLAVNDEGLIFIWRKEYT